MREAQVNLAYLWFAGYELGEKLPDHSSLTRIRQRWGEERFRRIFVKTVEQCAKAGLIGGETSHVDASLIRADVSWESLVAVYVEQALTENDEERIDGSELPSPGRVKTAVKVKGKIKKRSTTDPDASMSTSCKKVRLEPTYKQHTSVDDKIGLIVDVHVTTGEANEGKELRDQIKRITENTGTTPKMLTADTGYSNTRNYAMLEELGIEAVIPYEKPRMAKDGISSRRFKYDAKNEVVRCPKGKTLQKRHRGKNGWWYRARVCDCKACPLRAKCAPRGARTLLILDGYPALLRARTAKARGWSDEKVTEYKRHRYQVEGIHGESKSQHGLARAVRRGLANLRIQAYLTAMVINLKRLAKYAKRDGLLPRNTPQPIIPALFAMIIGHIRDTVITAHRYGEFAWLDRFDTGFIQHPHGDYFNGGR